MEDIIPILKYLIFPFNPMKFLFIRYAGKNGLTHSTKVKLSFSLYTLLRSPTTKSPKEEIVSTTSTFFSSIALI